MTGRRAFDIRYSRQVALPELGIDGQRKLLASSVLVVGCGALGGHLAQTMVRMGTGRVGVVDCDRPAIHNLHRQVMFNETDVASGIPKAEVAARKLRGLNRDAQVEAHVLRVDETNMAGLIETYDMVLDGTDNFETRYAINSACVSARKPWVYGGVMGTRATVMVIVPGHGPCLRCVLPRVPDRTRAESCVTHGVLPTTPMLVAAIQCTEALKLLIGQAPDMRLTSIETWPWRFTQVQMERRPDCPCCCELGRGGAS